MPDPSPDQFIQHLQKLSEQAVIEVERATFWLAVASVLSTALFFWLLYWVIRWGVRDGMKDAEGGRRHARAPSRPVIHDRDRISGPDLRTD